jgi:hypothetical protein
LNNDHSAAGRPAFAKARRRWLQRTLALAAAGTTGSMLLAFAADDAGAPLDSFMLLSRVLTGKPALDRALGARLLAALQDIESEFPLHLRQLAAGLPSGTLDAPQQAFGLRIVQAWYLGVVDNAVVTYEQALMFGVVSDTLTIRSYCPGKPGFWAAPPVERQA